jgi:predicted peroxiredoxin
MAMTSDQIMFEAVISGMDIPDSACHELAAAEAAELMDGNLVINMEGLVIIAKHTPDKSRRQQFMDWVIGVIQNAEDTGQIACWRDLMAKHGMILPE